MTVAWQELMQLTAHQLLTVCLGAALPCGEPGAGQEAYNLLVDA